MQSAMQNSKKTSGLVMVRWDRPGSIYHGQVHKVSQASVDYIGGGKVKVWWPSRSRGKRWDGELVDLDGKHCKCVVSQPQR